MLLQIGQKVRKNHQLRLFCAFLSVKESAGNDRNDRISETPHQELYSVVTFVDKVCFFEVKLFQSKRKITFSICSDFSDQVFLSWTFRKCTHQSRSENIWVFRVLDNWIFFLNVNELSKRHTDFFCFRNIWTISQKNCLRLRCISSVGV